jgi:hypothetical protein
MMTRNFIALLSFQVFFLLPQAHASEIIDYSDRYGVHDRFKKVVDNRGTGEERLYGVRNARMLFKVVLRGGANNAYHRTNPRNNMNPLPEDALNNLCQEGFTEANYLYPTAYSTASKEVNCTRFDGKPSTLRYRNFRFANGEDEKVLEMVYRHLTGREPGGLYLHCWNGWHASGYMSAISLMQFCGLSASDAVDYWNQNTDGVNSGSHYESIRERIRSFRPLPQFRLSDEEREEICAL